MKDEESETRSLKLLSTHTKLKLNTPNGSQFKSPHSPKVYQHA
jgi:hypothetical protein